MLLNLVRKLVLFLVALWAILSVVFFLSRSLPGSTESQLFGSVTETTISASQVKAQKQTYQQYLRRTHQDLPLFYVNLASAAEPDTLYKILPETDKQALKKLIFRYGHWAQIAAFYKGVQHFQTIIRQDQNAQHQLLNFSENLLHLALDQNAFNNYLKDMLKNPENEKVKPQLLQLQTDFNRLTQTATPAKVYVPALHFYGLKNQYHYWLSDVVKLDLGKSERDKRPVSNALSEAFGNTLLMLLLSLGLAFSLAVLLGFWLIKTRNYKWQKPVLAFLYALDSVPVFIIAMLLVLLFAGSFFLDIFPVYGLGEADTEGLTWLETINLHLYHITLPVICLVLVTLPYLTAQVFQALKAVMQTDFIRTAKAKGLSENAIIRRHAFRNVWLPLITLLSDYLPGLVAGALVIEVIFSIPGMGRLLAEAVLARDYPVITGVVLAVAAFRMLCYLAADAIYYIADPRTRQAV